MQQFVILTDSSCDLPAELAQQLQLEVVPLSVTVEQDTYKNYLDGREISAKAFYDKVRGRKEGIYFCGQYQYFYRSDGAAVAAG